MNSFLIAGLGASAGGLLALRTFFTSTPSDSGIAYVVILHLSPDHDSQLAKILQRATAMPVMQVTAKTLLEPDHVYVIPPDAHLTAEDGYITVSPNIDWADRRAPVDTLLRSLAKSHGEWSMAIILSGTGANGSMGLKHIKEHGGAVFVQDPGEAAFNDMPRHAIATGLVDEVLPVADIPARIISYRNMLNLVHSAGEPDDPGKEEQEALRIILTELRLHTGHDFTNYKRQTLVRRIQRRIRVWELPDLPSYAAYIAREPEECHALLKDLLISVTNFFRDNMPFEELAKNIIPELLKGKAAGDQLRIWVAGCATGEEAYSIAMICADLTRGLVSRPQVHIFATDIDESAIAAAREGSYTVNDAADVPQEWLSRYFTKEGTGYRVDRELRETVLFASHNFLKDSPFSRLDLVSCRNVLIYFNQVAQKRVIETFHFALNPGGFLLLGTSESVDAANDLFSVYNRDQHIWRSRLLTSKKIIIPEGLPRLELPKVSMHVPVEQQRQNISFGGLHQQMVELYAPPSLIVNEDFEVLHISEHATHYLRFMAGEPTQNLLKLVRDELRTELRSALYGAARLKKRVSAMGLQMRLDNDTAIINLHVQPMPESSVAVRGYMLVLFEPVPATGKDSTVVLSSDEPASRYMEEEMMRLKLQLRASNEQHEFATEELKAGNEELHAMNEELRSASEELNSSKEELQSINEELSTVNQELRIKVDESNLTNNNLRNIINSTDVGTIILDRSFRVVLFTPAAQAIFNLIGADYGRSLSDITNRLLEDKLEVDAEQVLQTLQTLERELEATNGCVYLTRLTPYRTKDDHIQGVVISLLDITARKHAEQSLRKAEERYRLKLEGDVEQRTAELKESKDLLQTTINSSLDMIQVFRAVRNEQGEIVDFTWILNNQSAEQVYGEVLGQRLLTVSPGVVEAGIFETFKKVVETGMPDQSEQHFTYAQFDGWFYQSTVKLGDGVASMTTDITRRKAAEQELRQSKILLQHIIDAPDIGIAVYKALRDESGVITDYVHQYINRASRDMLGEDLTNTLLSDHGESGTSQMPLFNEVIETGRGNRYVREILFRGHYVWFSITNTPLDGERLVHTWEDITARKSAEAEILRLKDEIAQKATNKYKDLFNSIAQPAATLEVLFDEQGHMVDHRFLETNPAHEEMTGISRQDMLDKRIAEMMPAISAMLIQLAGKPGRFELSEPGHWYDVHLSRVGGEESHEVVVVYNDITESKQRELLQAYLLKLNDAIRPLADPMEIQATAAQMLGEQLQTARAYYAEIYETADEFIVARDWHQPGSPGPTRFGNWRMPWLTDGKTWVVYDSGTDPAMPEEQRAFYLGNDIGAIVMVPLIKQDKLVATFVTNQREPRQWTTMEISFVEETAERTWAATERAKAEKLLAEELADTRTLQQISNRIIEENNIQLLFEAIVESAVALMRADMGSIQKLVPEEGQLSLLAWQGFHPDAARYWRLVTNHSASTCGIALAENKRFIVPDVETFAYFNDTEDLEMFRLSGIHAVQSTPLISRSGKLVGMLSTHWKYRHIPGSQELGLLDVLARQAADLIEQRQAEDALLITRERLRWQKEAFQSAINGAPLAYSLSILTQMVVKETDHQARTAFHVLNEAGTGLYTIRGAGDMPEAYADDMDGKLAREDAFAIGPAVIIPDVYQEHHQGPWTFWADKYNYSGYWSFPINTKEDIAVGSLAMYFREPRDASLQDLALAEIVTQSAAVIIASYTASQERGSAEAALRASEVRFRTLSDAVPQLIWANNAVGVANYFNQRWYEYTGLSFKQSLGLGWQVVVHPDDEPASKDRWLGALSNGTVFDTEFRLLGKDGMYRWFIARNVPMKDAQGQMEGWFGSATDIHDLKMAEEDLHNSRERLRITMESATDYAIITMDVDGQIEAWSKGAERIFGYDEAEVTGQLGDIIFTPEDRATGAPQKEMQKAREEGRAEDERWHLRRDGSRFYMSGVTSPIYDGQLTGYVKVARDMTGQKASEEQLRLSEERYRVALQSADMAAWDWNIREDKIRWNDQHFLLLGLLPEDKVLDSGFFLQFIHPDDLAMVTAALMEAVHETGHYRAESFRIVRADGQVCWMSGYGRTVLWEDGKSARMVGVMFDITNRKELEQQKEQFIGIASHELKTPVTSIKAYTEILEELFIESGDMRSADLMRKMDVQVDRLTSLIYALLDSTRIAGGKLELQRSAVEIDGLITETAEPMQRVAGKQRIELELEAGITVHADRERIRQVLINFLSNAMKYAPGTERIVVRSAVRNEDLMISVRDYGIGIDQHEQQKVFDQFFRATGSNNASGLGLGLFISATIILEHGGHIWVESKKGEGSLFCFTIPLTKE
jgi:PAS domain S-box-containing protein